MNAPSVQDYLKLLYGFVPTLSSVSWLKIEEGDLVALAHKRCHIVLEEHEEGGTHLAMYAPPDCVHMFDESRF